MAKKKIGDLISEWMDEFGPANGYELHRSEFVKEGSTWYLRVFIDKIENGEYVYVGSEDCLEVTRFLNKKLDEADPIKQAYYLEVSSPGMDRPLISDKDYERFKGSLVEIKLFKPLEGTKIKEFAAELVGKKDNTVIIKDEEGTEISLPLESIAKINLAVVF